MAEHQTLENHPVVYTSPDGGWVEHDELNVAVRMFELTQIPFQEIAVPPICREGGRDGVAHR